MLTPKKNGMDKPKCTKKVFITRPIAKRWLKKKNKDPRMTKPLTSVYFCNECEVYHVTSEDKSTRKFYKDQNNA